MTRVGSRLGAAIGRLVRRVPVLQPAVDQLAERVLLGAQLRGRQLEPQAQAWLAARRPLLAVCPGCGHTRGRHRVVEWGGRGPCLAPGCSCAEYGGPWPVHHLNVTTQPCDVCGQPGGHWAVAMDGGLLVVPTYRDLPGET